MREASEREEVVRVAKVPPDERGPDHPWPKVCDAYGKESWSKLPENRKDPNWPYCRAKLATVRGVTLSCSTDRHYVFLCDCCWRRACAGRHLSLRQGVYDEAYDCEVTATANFSDAPTRRQVLESAGAAYTPKGR